MKTAYIIGASGHGSVIESIIHTSYNKIIFVDLKPSSAQVLSQEYFFNHFSQYIENEIFIGIGDNKARKNIYEKLIFLGKTPSNCIASNAFIAHNAKIGNGVFVGAGAVVGANALVGNNVIINTLSSVDHDCEVGNHSQITAGVNLGGGTVMGENCFLGIKSATIPLVKIGNNSQIMAGSIVFKNVPDNVLVGGNPAVVIKKL